MPPPACVSTKERKWNLECYIKISRNGQNLVMDKKEKSCGKIVQKKYRLKLIAIRI